MLLKACLNGNRLPGSHPALPLTPNAIAQDAQRTMEAGARALHIHPRGTDGRDSSPYWLAIVGRIPMRAWLSFTPWRQSAMRPRTKWY